MLLLYYMILLISKPFITLSVLCDCVTCDCDMCDITLHPLPQSKIKKSENENQK